MRRWPCGRTCPIRSKPGCLIRRTRCRVPCDGFIRPGCSKPFARCRSDPSQRYQFRVAGNDGEVTTMHDPYSFSSLLTDFDFYLFGQGRHERIYDKLGAQVRTVDGVTGTNFAVWAPNATAVSVIGEFNRWDTRRHPMRKHIPSGIWELFIPEVRAGQQYKFRVRSWDGDVVDKTDPVRICGRVAAAHGIDRGGPVAFPLDRRSAGWSSAARATR